MRDPGRTKTKAFDDVKSNVSAFRHCNMLGNLSRSHRSCLFTTHPDSGLHNGATLPPRCRPVPPRAEPLPPRCRRVAEK